MITLRPITEDDWQAAQAWRTGAWALPRNTTPADFDPTGDPYFALVSGEQLRAIGGLIDQELLPPGTARLTILCAPTGSNQHQLCAYTRLLVREAFTRQQLTTVVAQVPRDPDTPAVFPVWQWIVDRVTRDLGGPVEDEQIVASGGWWFESDGVSQINPDKASPLYLHWLRR